ncbi:MAG: CTP synthetase [Phyllobacteriaceae bacterium]|jgi:putative flippase GtrA|nr:CTP synthetase [Phyllobacteriaceae bacterium]
MIRLMLMLFAVVGTTLMGIGVVTVLTLRMDTAMPIIASAAAGFVLAIPISWFVAKQMTAATKR